MRPEEKLKKLLTMNYITGKYEFEGENPTFNLYLRS